MPKKQASFAVGPAANATRRCAASSNPVSASAVRLAEALAPAGLKRWEGMGAGTRGPAPL